MFQKKVASMLNRVGLFDSCAVGTVRYIAFSNNFHQKQIRQQSLRPDP